MTRWLVLGAGYTGSRVASLLSSRGDRVLVTRRSLSSALSVAPAGAEARAVELSDPLSFHDLFAPGDLVVLTAAPLDEHATAERALATSAARAPIARLIYVSSTAVYGPGHGAWIDEDAAVAPTSSAGRARVAAEDALRAAAPIVVVLRAAGIHGPDRGVIARLRAGTYRQLGDGRTATSRIHVDDLAAAIVAAGDHPAPLPVYNAADDDPAPTADVVAAACAHFHLPAPPSVPLAAVDPEIAAMVAADRKIRNARLREHLGVALRHPTWRTSLDG